MDEINWPDLESLIPDGDKLQPNSWIIIPPKFDLPPAVPWKLNLLDKFLLKKMGIASE